MKFYKVFGIKAFIFLHEFGVFVFAVLGKHPRGGGVLCYFYTYVGSGHFSGSKILNFNIILGFQKKLYFWGV